MKFVYLALLCLFATHLANAQTKDPALYRTIAHMDSVMFNAFNTQDLATLKTVFAPELEFYNDGGGISDYATTIKNFESMFARNTHSGLRRELVAGSLEVYPIPGFGAIEMATHRFIHTENGKEEVGTMKFVEVWKNNNGNWQATRVMSVGH